MALVEDKLLDPEAVCKEVIKIISTKCFGADIYADKDFMKTLKESLPTLYDILKDREPENVKMEIATDIAKIRLNVKKFKKDDIHRMCYCAALVLLYTRIPEHRSYILSLEFDEMTLLKAYPEFEELKAKNKQHELDILRNFRNTMKVCQTMMPPEQNKKFLLEIVTRIVEGSDRNYITGSGQTEATKRRVHIYEQEGEIIVKSRQKKDHAVLILTGREHYQADDDLFKENETQTRRGDNEMPGHDRPNTKSNQIVTAGTNICVDGEEMLAMLSKPFRNIIPHWEKYWEDFKIHTMDPLYDRNSEHTVKRSKTDEGTVDDDITHAGVADSGSTSGLGFVEQDDGFTASDSSCALDMLARISDTFYSQDPILGLMPGDTETEAS